MPLSKKPTILHLDLNVNTIPSTAGQCPKCSEGRGTLCLWCSCRLHPSSFRERLAYSLTDMLAMEVCAVDGGSQLIRIWVGYPKLRQGEWEEHKRRPELEGYGYSGRGMADQGAEGFPVVASVPCCVLGNRLARSEPNPLLPDTEVLDYGDSIDAESLFDREGLRADDEWEVLVHDAPRRCSSRRR